jgi:hypothetical protein
VGGGGGGGSKITDVYYIGKVAFVALLGVVTLEVTLIARYWTWLFGILTFLSFFLVYPSLIVFFYIEIWINCKDPTNMDVWSLIQHRHSGWPYQHATCSPLVPDWLRAKRNAVLRRRGSREWVLCFQSNPCFV